MDHRLIEGVTKRISENSESYTVKYYCPTDNDLANLEPTKGSAASWCPVAARVSDIDVTPLLKGGAPYLLILTASPTAGGGESSGYLDRTNYSNCVIRSYETSEILMRHEWFGLRKSTSKDVELGIRNLDDNSCVSGEWIFNNATTSSSGSADLCSSPFVETSVSNSTVKEQMGQKMKVDVFCCEYYSRSDINSKAHFEGVSGSFSGRGTPYSSGAGNWRAMGQTLTEVLDEKGVVWTRVVKRAEHSPAGYKFSAKKNNGYWRW